MYINLTHWQLTIYASSSILELYILSTMIKVSRSMKLQVGLMSLLKMSNSKWWWMVQSIQSSIPKWYTTCVKKCDKLMSRRWWQHFSEYYFMMCWITLTPKLSINFLRYCYIIHLCPLKILDKNPTKKMWENFKK